MGKVTNFKGIRNMNTIGMAIRFLLCSMVQSHCKWGKHYNFQGHPTTLPNMAQGLSLSLNSREALNSFVLWMEQGTQCLCTAIKKP